MVHDRVAVSIPTFGCTPYLRQAVTSVLAQTYEELVVYVVSDGDGAAPWEVLSDIEDPRLHFIELDSRRGPYFIHDLVLRAAETEFLLIQDADDWSEPNRVEVLANELHRRHGLVGAVSGQFYEGLYQSYATTFAAPLKPEWYLDRVRHHGLYRSAGLLEVGGYHAGFRFAFDSYLTNVLHVCNALGYVDVPLYHRRRRSDSLSRSTETGLDTPARATVTRQLVAAWRHLLEQSTSGKTGQELRQAAASLAASMLGEEGATMRDTLVRDLVEHRDEGAVRLATSRG